MARFGDGLGIDTDLLVAAEHAATSALQALAGRRPDVAWVFVSGGDPESMGAALERAAQVAGARTSLGAGTTAVRGSSTEQGESAVAVMVGVLPRVVIRSFHLEVMRVAEGMAVVGLPERQSEDELTLMFADPWSFPADGFAAQVTAISPDSAVVGGLVAGSTSPGMSRLLLDGRVVDRGAVGAVLSGPVGARVVSAPSSRGIGPPMTVTKSEGAQLFGLADGFAADALSRVLDSLDPTDQALASRGVQIGLASDEYAEAHLEGDYLMRPILAVDRIRGTITVGEEVEVGRTVRFHLRDPDDADRQLLRASQSLLSDTGFDTVEALLMLGSNERIEDLSRELAVVSKQLSSPASLAASVAGELVPVAGRVALQGWTTTLLAFGSGSVADRGTSI